MLQQTTVKTVAPYYARFLAQWPTVNALAKAELDDVLRAWAGLGYYARARNLHACAKAVIARHSGQFPDDLDALRALPGIGDYTAAAIAAIAFDGPAVPVDGNIERVIVAALRDQGRTAGGKAGHQTVCCFAAAAAPHGRFRAGHDGSRRHHLLAQASGVCVVPLEQFMCG